MQGTTIPPHSDDPQQPYQPVQQPVQAPPPLPAEQPTTAEPAMPAPSWVPGYPGYQGYQGYQGYPGYQNDYPGGNYQGMPPVPPAGIVESAPQRPSRRGLAVIGALVALLLMLLVGVA